MYIIIWNTVNNVSIMKMKIRSKDYEANVLAIMELPFVKKLIEENKKLKKKNKALKNLIYSLPEFRRPEVTHHVDSDVEIVEPPTEIKKERIVYEIEEKDNDSVESPKIVGDLTKCEFSMNSFTDVNAPSMDTNANDEDDRYTTCGNCDEKVDCDKQHIFCLYSGNESNPTSEITICEPCNADLKEEFQQDGFKCDDWEEEEEEEEVEVEEEEEEEVEKKKKKKKKKKKRRKRSRRGRGRVEEEEEEEEEEVEETEEEEVEETEEEEEEEEEEVEETEEEEEEEEEEVEETEEEEKKRKK